MTHFYKIKIAAINHVLTVHVYWGILLNGTEERAQSVE